MNTYNLYIAGLLLTMLASCASPPQRDRVIGDWRVMVLHAGKPDMLCYAGASPTDSEGTARARDGKPYLMATRRASGKIEISASAGYAFKPGSKVELALDDETHSLFFKDGTAWARSDAEDKTIIEDMKAAEDIELRGVSKAGLTSVDHYPPQGFAGAIARIRELCP